MSVEAGGLESLQDLFVQANAVPQPGNSNDHRNDEGKFDWISLVSRVGLAVMTLLALAGPLQAQGSECWISTRRECGNRMQPPEDNGVRTSAIGLVPDSPVTPSTVETGSDPAAYQPTEASDVNPPEVVVGPCSAPIRCADWYQATQRSPISIDSKPEPTESGDRPSEDLKPSSINLTGNSKPTDPNQGTYYKNRLEFSLDGGWLPINIPFVFDVFLGDGYTMTPLKYTLVPIIGSIRWQIDNVGGPWIFRGNWDLQCSAAVTFIPRGPETRYISWIIGFRRNFVPRRGRIAPYFDGRVGLGKIDAKGPQGVPYAQGQNFTFTMNMGSGVRYNFNPRYSVSAGLNWMHISNLYLSEPQFANYGINVYGSMFGIDIRLGGARHHGSE